MKCRCPKAWKRLDKLIKVLFVTTIVAVILTIFGFASPVWISAPIKYIFIDINGNNVGKGHFNHLGLWQACGVGKDCVGVSRDLPGM